MENSDDGARVLEATEISLKDLVFPYGADPALAITYPYDVGEDWNHSLIMRPGPSEEGVTHPRCIAGARACPPEDVGGYGGDADVLETWLDSDHKDHKTNRRWAGRTFDPERFDIEAINKTIARALRARKGDNRRRTA